MRSLIFLSLLAAAGALPAQDDKVFELGRQVYQMCVACHGPDGTGVKAGDLLMAPTLHDSIFIKEDNPDLLTAIILKGILKEDTKYVQAMLPLELALNDTQLAAVVAYVTQEFGGKRRDATPADIDKWRKRFAEQTSPWKRADLETALKEAEAPKFLTNVTYSLYEGKWEELPDFSQLEPKRTGKIDSDVISLEPARDIKGPFGMVFEGNLSLPAAEEYRFSITSDDGSALVVDGETVVGNDGIHPVRTIRMKQQLEPGEHTIKVLYFDGGGQRFLSLNMDGKSTGKVWLSSVKSEGQTKSQSYDPIPLQPANPGEAIVHRAFLPDAKPRAIGVGYPGKVSLVWDADVLNLAYVYRGDFMDVANHWNGRGHASDPIGVDRVKTAQGFPLQVLESLDAPWEPFSRATIPYERDTADPQKEITFDIKHPDYRFRGYRLDKNRFPTFRYDSLGLAVTDRFDPEPVDGVTSLVRTITFEGDVPANLYFRLADTGSQEVKDGWIDIGGNMKIRVSGAEPVFRQSDGRKETLAPVTGGPLTVTYRWNEPLKP